MSITLSSTTPVATGNNTLVAWQKDGSGNVSGQVGTGLPVRAVLFAPGTGTANQVLFYGELGLGAIFPAGASASSAVAKVSATASTTFNLLQGTATFATVVFTAGATVGIFSQAATVTFTAATIYEVDGPVSPDATLANVCITLAGARS